MTEHLRIGLVQMASTPAWGENFATVRRTIARLAGRCELLVFPENVLCLGAGDAVRAAARSESELCLELGALAAQAGGAAVVYGGVAVRDADGIRNAALVFDAHGSLLARYDKIHLFQLDPERPGGIDETTTYVHGAQPVHVEWRGWRIGLSICYDLRFPELYRALAPVDLALCTAAFTAATGEAHWEVLLRARAIENQCYVAGVGQCGENRETHTRHHGHTLVADPWGAIVATACPATEETVVKLTLDRASLAHMRRRLPALRHRRLA